MCGVPLGSVCCVIRQCVCMCKFRVRGLSLGSVFVCVYYMSRVFMCMFTCLVCVYVSVTCQPCVHYTCFKAVCVCILHVYAVSVGL